MNTKVLRQLSGMTIQDGKINKSVSDYVLKHLNKKDLKTYLRLIKQEIEQNKIYVTIALEPDGETKRAIKSMFPGKRIIYTIDKQLGGGMRIQADDTIININVKSLVAQMVQQVKE